MSLTGRARFFPVGLGKSVPYQLAYSKRARDAGFGTARPMHQRIQAAPGVAPTAYRRAFLGTSGLSSSA